jgi:PPIC-type PPIASE domain
MSDLRRQARADLIRSEISRRVTAKIMVSAREVAEYYRRNIHSYALPRRRHICEALVPTLATAKAVRKKLSQRRSLCRWVKGYASHGRNSLDSGEFVARAHEMLPALDRAAFSLPADRLSEPIPASFGFYLVQPVGRVEPVGVIPFTRAQESIEEKLLQSKRSVAMAEWVRATHSLYADRVSLATP